MRTYLTRLTMTAAGVALTGLSLAGVAHADDGVVNLEPCDEINASDDMLFPVDPNWEPGELGLPAEPDDVEPAKPWGEFELVPCYQIPVEPDDDGDEPDDGDDGDEGEQPEDDGDGDDDTEPAGDNGGQGGNGAPGQPAGNPDTSDGAGDEGFGDSADETSQPQDTVTPTAATAAGDNSMMLLAALAGVLGALGLFLLIYGMRKRPRRGQQPAR
jgi:hypothetical protein